MRKYTHMSVPLSFKKSRGRMGKWERRREEGDGMKDLCIYSFVRLFIQSSLAGELA